MNYWNGYDYFEEDKSEADQIIEEATEKLVGLISEKTKSEIERYKNWYESADKMRAELQKQVYELGEQNEILKLDAKTAKEELERQDNEIPKIKFIPGEQVYYLANTKRVDVACPTCQGTGSVTIKTEEFGDQKITCPRCKGIGDKRCLSYYTVTPTQAWVVGVNIDIELGKQRPTFKYILHESYEKPTQKSAGWICCSRDEDQLFKSKSDATKAAQEEIQRRKEEAERRQLIQ